MYHHRPQSQITDQCTVVTALYIANGIADMIVFEKTFNYPAYLSLDYLQQFIDLKQLDTWTDWCREMMLTQKDG